MFLHAWNFLAAEGAEAVREAEKGSIAQGPAGQHRTGPSRGVGRIQKPGGDELYFVDSHAGPGSSLQTDQFADHVANNAITSRFQYQCMPAIS
jgi:hypothetical protein